MLRFNVEYFISRRIGSRAGAERIGIMTRIAIVTVAIGVAVMIIALAVISGFKKEITANLTGFGADVQVLNYYNANQLETMSVERDAAIEAQLAALPACSKLYPFAVKGGVLRTQDAIEGVMLKGVDGDFDWGFFGRHLTAGEVPAVGDSVRNKDIMLSATVAGALNLAVDDRVEMLFVSPDAAPRRDRFRVCGIYRTGFDELDRAVVITDIRNVQRLNGWDSLQVTGYELMASPQAGMKALDSQVKAQLRDYKGPSGQALTAVDIAERFPGLFDWLEAHNVNAAVIITIMLLVALLNMGSALLIILLERTQMIGVLKSLGMATRGVQKIFVYRSSFILLRGMAWGNAVGLGLCAVQAVWHPVKLDRAGYFLSQVPVSFDWQWWLALNAGSFAVMLAVMVLPTMIISYLKPDTTLRFR